MKRPAFTLVELLVYISISAIALVVFTNFAVTASQSAARSRITQELQQNARLVMDRLSQEIRGAQAIISTPQDFTDGVLILTTATGPHTFAVNGSAALTLDSGSGAQELTGRKVTVSSFQLTDTNPTVTIVLTLSDTISNPPQSITVSTSLIPHRQLYL